MSGGPLGKRDSILGLLAIDGGRVLSLEQIALELPGGMGSVSYHVRVLEKAGLVKSVREKRGESTLLYRLTPRTSGEAVAHMI